MKFQSTIHITAVERLYREDILTSDEYKSIMAKIAERVAAEKEDDSDG